MFNDYCMWGHCLADFSKVAGSNGRKSFSTHALLVKSLKDVAINISPRYDHD